MSENTQNPVPAELPALPAAPADSPALSPVAVCFALGNMDRFQMVRLLADGRPRTVLEVAQSLGRKRGGVGKHLRILSWAGVVAAGTPEGADGRYSWYQIPAAYRATPGVLDFGCCTVRL